LIYNDFALSGKTLRLSVFAENIVRVRVSKKFEQTLFERYGIFKESDEIGEKTQSGVKAGQLGVSFDGQKIIISKGGGIRYEINFSKDIAADSKWYNEQLNRFRPDSQRILGDDAKRTINTVDFEKDPKSLTMKTLHGERFYGLGTGNHEDLILNGRTYLQRVVYATSEIPIPFVMSENIGVLCAATIWHGIDICNRNENEIGWFLPDGEIDFYIFGGDSLKENLRLFTRLTGRSALLPKWAYGLTFIDQYKADQFEVMRNAADFRKKKLPCDMISLEPGWMETEYDFSTKKKWDVDKFYICDWMRHDEPGKQMFTAALKRYGFKLALWLCCQHDFTADEETRAGNPTDFGIEPWYLHLRQFVNDGAAAFKMDPCRIVDGANEQRVYANGRGEPEMHNLMQTLYQKQMYYGISEHTKQRPMHHFCGGFTGTAQYGAATTGDSGGGHKTMVWVLNCGLSGLSNITCDMDIFSPQTLHYCFFTAWCQLNSWSGFRQPWWAGDDNEECFAFYDRNRYALLPYIYSAAIESNMTGLPVVRAMPLEFSDTEVENTVAQFMFGKELLVGAFTDKVWLPRNEVWIDFWSGKEYQGGQWVEGTTPENRGGPLFIRGGAIIPTQPERQFTSCKDEPVLNLKIYPCKTSEYTLWEDDGLSLSETRAKTVFSVEAGAKTIKLKLGPRTGSFEGMCIRMYNLTVRCDCAKEVLIGGRPQSFSCESGFIKFAARDGDEITIKL